MVISSTSLGPKTVGPYVLVSGTTFGAHLQILIIVAWQLFSFLSKGHPL
jgi:hypothetical protein